MRIAFFHHYSLTFGGGGERFLLELSEFLVNRGHEVEIHALPFRRGNAPVDSPRGVRYCEGLVHRVRADVSYHVYAPLVSEAFRCDAPRIAGLHGAVVADYVSPASFYYRQGPFVAGAYAARQTLGAYDLGRFDAIHTVTPIPLNGRRVYVLPNWVDCANTGRALEAKRARRPTFNVLYVGKPSYTKGFDLVADLSRSMAREGVEFWAASPADRRFNDGGPLKWVGYVPPDRMWELYSKASVLLHPTRQETFGRVIIESIAAGTPVVTTPIPSHVSMGLPLEYAATEAEMRDRIEALHEKWRADYEGYYETTKTLAQAAQRYDRRAILPRYERMLLEVANRGAM